ncbi:hypothetical protein MIND_00782800 [Mycena indigotica]|uniref:Peptidase A1 domain-containing protein n=1 Tax=Mycena indigotica TaxID=2126181 RepID=A0A8H6W1K2_9AGAR|nr:uncharacterized protein MIND_00782800 [Mycena indigotica]KAF7302159.1 hypothetical protein MIND_00782800 [Mycena indigotica]
MSEPLLFEIKAFPRSSNSKWHLRSLIAAVEKHKVVKPDEHAWGIFYDPFIGTACFHAPTQPGDGPRSLSANSQDRSESQIEATHSSGSDSVPCRSEFQSRWALAAQSPLVIRTASITALRDGETNEPEHIQGQMIPLEQRKLPADGLHYVRMASHQENPKEMAHTGITPIRSRTKWPKLLVDTGCSVTWMYHPDAVLLTVQVNDSESNLRTSTKFVKSNHVTKLERHDRAISFSGHAEATQPGKVYRLSFPDSFHANLQLFRGPLSLLQKFDWERESFDFHCLEDMVFGLATAATLETTKNWKPPTSLQHATQGHRRFRHHDQMDGILGLALAYDTSPFELAAAPPDLFVPKFCQSIGFEVSRFTIALGIGEQTSWMILGPNNNDPKQRREHDRIAHDTWSPWMECNSQLKHWTVKLFGVTVGNQPTVVFPSGLDMAIDTGSQLSVFPPSVCKGLFKAMGEMGFTAYGLGEVALNNPALAKTKVTFILAEGYQITLPSLEPLIDVDSSQNQGSAICTFHAGAIENEKYGLFGNSLLRGLVIEFEHSRRSFMGGRIRVALRA